MSTQMTWQPIETCPENTWVLVQAEWDTPPVHINKFVWGTVHGWDVVSESSGSSGARRQIRQEKITQHRIWDNGIGEHGVGDYRYWQPLPEQMRGDGQ